MSVNKRSRNRRGRVLVGMFAGVVLAGLVMIAVLFSQYQQFQASRLNLPEGGRTYEVAAGTSLSRLAHDLNQQGIIRYPRFLILLGRELDVAHRLQTGEYQLDYGMTPQVLLEKLTSGEVIQYALTLIEGQTFTEMLALIHARGDFEPTLQGLDAEEIMARLGRTGEHPEGRFLPDTYYFPRGTTDAQVLQRAYHAMESRLSEEWAQREAGLPLQTPDEALILASIVEKETGLAGERPAIAGVFIRRLEKGMRLQTDPTVIYGLGERFDGNLRLRDLRADTPYNTYTRDGLPPTPIAMPGAEAIHAVLHPDRHEYLYFVATGNGGHYFSRTLQEHNRAVQKFQQGKTGITLSEPDQRL